MRALLAVLMVIALSGCLTSGSTPDSTTDPEPPQAQPAPGVPDVAEDVEYNLEGPYSRVLEPGPFAVKSVQRIDLAGFDGTDIAVALWLPDGPADETYPLIVHAGPYFGDGVDTLDSWTENFWLENFVKHGYAFAKVSTRGTGQSGGCIEWWGPNEAKDLNAMVTALSEMPWSDGQIAMTGLSYAAGAAWMAASFGNPALKSIIVAGSTTDVGLLHYLNGTIAESASPTEHVSSYWLLTAQGGRSQPDPRWAEAACEDIAMGAVGNPWASADGDISESSVFWDYWRERDYRQRILDNYKGSVYIVQGFFDYVSDSHQVYPLVQQFEAQGQRVHHLNGQWGHTWPDIGFGPNYGRVDYAEMLLHYLDAEMRGGPEPEWPRSEVQDNLGNWRVEDTWPPLDAIRTPFYLGPAGLTTEPQEIGSSIGADPASIGVGASAAGVVSEWWFTTGALESELRFAGTPYLPLTINPLTDIGGEVYADLWYREGGQDSFLTRGIMDLKYHAGGKSPQPIERDVTLIARMQLEPVDVVIPAGAELALRITPVIHDGPGGLEPVSRNPAPFRLLWGEGRTTLLELPLIERDVGDGRYKGQPGRA